MIVGLLSFAVSFFSIGLAIAALDKPNERLWLVITPFVVGGLLFLCAVAAMISLLIHTGTLNRQIQQIAEYLRQAYKLRNEILKTSWDSQFADRASQWETEVQRWLDSELPEHGPDFGLERFSSTPSFFSYNNVNEKASATALRLEARAGNLREILRDIRR